MHGLLSSYLKFLDHACTTSFVFANLLEIFFKILLQMVKDIWMRFKEAFSRFEIFSPISNPFLLWLNKTPPQWNSPLSVQEGFTNFEDTSTFSPFWKHIKIPILRTSFKNSLVVRSFCFGLILLPLWHESPKTDTLSEI
jgi:hypothetical protein